jgi:hypothetical protein
MERIQILKRGKVTSSEGVAFDFTDAVLKEIADGYDPAKHESPIVIGHPKSNDPAVGWVAGVQFADGEVGAEERQLHPAFVEARDAGSFKKRSASIYLPDSPGNPTPGKHYLRHVGYLGAMPPAIKGMRDALTTNFAEQEEGVLNFDDAYEGSWALSTINTLFRGMREFFIEKFGLEVADKALPNHMIENVRREMQPVSSSYAEPGDGKELINPEGGDPVSDDKNKAADFAERETALANESAKLKAREEALAAKERESARRETVDFVEGLIKEGRVLPVQKSGYVEALLACDGREPIEFSEGDKKVTKSPREALMASLKATPKVVEFGEAAPAAKGAPAALPDDPAEAGKEIAKRAQDFMESEAKAGHTVTLMDAVEHVTKG